MQVPVYERQAQIQPINPNPDAFGVNIAQANQQLGQTTSNIGQLLQQRAKELQQQKDTQKVLEAETQMRQEIDGVLYSQDTDENGRPVGIMNRTLANANGVTQDFKDQIEQIRQKYSRMVPGEEQQTQFDQLYKSMYDSNMNMVVRHEAQQGQASREQTTQDNINQKIKDAASNPYSLVDSIANINAIVKVTGDYNGDTPDSIKFNQQASSGAAALKAFESLFQKEDYKGAQGLFDKVKDYLPGDVADTIKTKIDAGDWGAKQTTISDDLLKKYGENLASGDKYIKNLSLTPEKQKELLDTYHSTYNLREQEKRATINTQIDYYYKNVEGAGNGLTAVKYINTLPQKTADQLQVKTSLLTIAKQLYPELTKAGQGIKTDPAAWYELYDKIKAGKIANRQEMLKEYGSRISFDDMKTFWKAMDSMGTVGTSPYNKFNLATDGAALLKKSGIKDSDQQAKFWDYVSGVAGDFQFKNKRPPTSEEKDKILQDALTKTITGKWKLGPLGGNKTDHRFNIPPDAQWSKKLSAWVYRDENGNLMKYNP
ncbi:MAG TPA: hypothetical protein DDW50_20960 [Firmicutes bacterium]|jgi:hypothetical protein|nr:hypothetical protein [Bacillota bacterium]